MDFLFTELLLWARDERYEWFSLGMAPLSGLEPHPLGPLWNRFGALLFRYGEHFYHFRGLREFKDKFQPEWAPRYLAAPGGLAAPIALTRIAGLVSGSVSGLIRR
jgi:phosphatidylglycerol lysyltransferase